MQVGVQWLAWLWSKAQSLLYRTAQTLLFLLLTSAPVQTLLESISSVYAVMRVLPVGTLVIAVNYCCVSLAFKPAVFQFAFDGGPRDEMIVVPHPWLATKVNFCCI